MRKRILSIWSVLLVLVISIAILVPSCTPSTQGTIEVKATFDGSPWTGAVDYTLTGPGIASPITGTSVDDSFTVDTGSWTCTYDGGGPGTFVDITPSETQELPDGETITFTLNFEIPPLDASITFVSWTIDGQQVDPGHHTVYPPTTIDCEYDIYVAGNYCESVNVTAAFKLPKHFLGEAEYQSWHVANAPGSVSTIPPGTIWSQEASVNGTVHPACYTFDVFKCVPMYYDVTITVELHKGTNNRVKINWLRYKSSGPENVLFDTDIVGAGVSGSSDLVTSGCVHVDEDVNPANDCSGDSPTLSITYDYSGLPG